MASPVKPSDRNFARRIDLTSLQLFVAVCELGSIGKAAEREFIAASAVSKRLSDLEATLETPLLYRHTRGVDLTPAGESLLHHARSVLFSLEKMQGELSEYADGVRGHVRIHASISAIVQFLPEDLGAFIKEHGQVKIDLEEHLSTEIVRAVQEGAADLGICNADVLANGHELQALPYREDQLVLIVPRRHPLARRKAVAFEQTLECDHVGLHTNSSIYIAMREAAAAAGRTIKLRIHVTGLDAMCRMIHNGLGVGVMPLRAFELMQGVGELESVVLTDAWARRRIELVARDFSTLPLTARLLVDHLTAPLEVAHAAAAA
ncbi:MAG: transcriptional regulator, LysR family [Ramlibacter sp.]|jgi:DNA-binding transcriptional LysR family regulator|nr:transcriptional regulator, LysR family [Ramlibacter sp.]